MEIEVSLWSYEEETKKGTRHAYLVRNVIGLTCNTVIATAKELGVTIAAYSYVRLPEALTLADALLGHLDEVSSRAQSRAPRTSRVSSHRARAAPSTPVN